MADFESGLPIRSEADGTDERVQTKIVDASSPDTQQMEVDTDGNAHVEAHGNNPAGGDEVLRMSELGSASVDGVYDGTNNSDPSQVGVVGMDRNASPADSQQTLRVTAKANAAGDVRALDIALHDEDGEPFSASNPLPITMEQSEGTEIHDFDEGTAIAKDATSTHDYSVADTVVFTLHQVLSSGSGKMKVEIQVGDGAASEVFATKAITFNSTAAPQADVALAVPIVVTGTANTTTVRVIRTNLDNQPQDLHSTIIGVEN